MFSMKIIIKDSKFQNTEYDFYINLVLCDVSGSAQKLIELYSTRN